MLALEYNSARVSVAFPCFVQPKLDGVRLLATRCADGSICMWTRNGIDVVEKQKNKEGKNVKNNAKVNVDDHASRSLIAGIRAELAKSTLQIGVVLDGELYAHSLTFQESVSHFKNDTGAGYLAYHVYDMYDRLAPHDTMQDRLQRLSQLAVPIVNIIRHTTSSTNNTNERNNEKINDTSRDTSGPVVLLDSYMAHSHEDVKAYHDTFVKMGYEGLMLRAMLGEYEPAKRSKNLLKLKVFTTDEFVIIGVVEAKGGDKGTAVFVCHVPTSDRTFNVRLKASRQERRRIWEEHVADPKRHVGKRLTVQYQELTDGGLPRFPVGLAIRDYE